MIDTSKLDNIGAKIDSIMGKKLSKLKLTQGSSNLSLTIEKFFSCKIYGGTNHDTSYFGGSNSEHMATVDFGGIQSRKGSGHELQRLWVKSRLCGGYEL